MARDLFFGPQPWAARAAPAPARRLAPRGFFNSVFFSPQAPCPRRRRVCRAPTPPAHWELKCPFPNSCGRPFGLWPARQAFCIGPITMGGMANFMLPPLFYVPDMIFPRLNNMSFWVFSKSISSSAHEIFTEDGIGCGWTL